MAKIIISKPSLCGIPLGGIGTGSVELLPDGEFHFWQIANQERFTTVCHERSVDDGEKSCGALSFYVRTQEESKKPVLRKLGMKTDPDDFSYRLFPFNKPVESIEFDGRFPVCQLNYIDSALPVKLSLKAVSPFVPHNSDFSATPGFYLDFSVENITDKKVDFSLAGMLEPSFAGKDGTSNTLINTDDSVGVFLETECESSSPFFGNLCFSIGGDGEKSYITGDYRRFMREYYAYSDFGTSLESFLFSFREKGKLPNTLAGMEPDKIPDDLSVLSDGEIDSLYDGICGYAFAKSRIARLKALNPDFPVNRNDKENLLNSIRNGWNIRISQYGSDAFFGNTALCSNITLMPRETKTVGFVLSWYFKNHYSKGNVRLGHYYENLFSSSMEANAFLINNRDKVFDKAVAFSNLLYNTSLPEVYPDSWSGHLSTLVKCSWYLKDGKFGLWEGLGFCGFHTTDITYHASFGLLALFPDLQLKQMRMGAEFQRDDGRVHHFFTPDLDHVDDGFDRVDMNMQFVLMVLRDFLYTGDRTYLTDMWKHVEAAMDSIEALDKNKDGLPDCDTKRNTYDAWNFSGTPTYIAILWLSALKAASIIADRLSFSERKEYWISLLNKGRDSLERLLWNGSYYNLWTDGEFSDESIMTDQLDGEWFLRASGIGGIMDDDRVRAVAKAIYDNCFDPDGGLVNAVCPEGRKTSPHTYKNCQTDAVWTGIGYIFAALCLSVGMKKEAEEQLRCISHNQMRLGCFWDHWECGHHYSRPLSSFTTMNTISGLRIDREKKTITLKPVYDNITLPLCTCDFLATLHISNEKMKIECMEGNADEYEIKLTE